MSRVCAVTDPGLVGTVALPLGLGLFGFVEPCSIGTTLLFVKTLEGRPGSAKLSQVGVFMGVRAFFMGALGVAAAALGGVFLGFQKAAWIGFGALYAILGILYLTGRSGSIARSLGPGLTRLSSVNGAAALGTLFALNIPACAGPLLLALLGMAAAGGSATDPTLARGFASLALFGLALSLPILLATLFPRAQLVLDRLAALSRRAPLWTGAVLLALGAWSIWFGLFVSVTKPA